MHSKSLIIKHSFWIMKRGSNFLGSMIFDMRSKSYGFSLIELIVTTAIMGILIASVIPALGRFNRDNMIFLAAGKVRQELSDIRSYSTAPDPTICPVLPNSAIVHTINNYSLFIPVAATAQTPVADPNTAGSQYECGDSTLSSPSIPQTLTNKQYAILARSIEYNTAGAVLNERTIGVVRVGELDAPVVAISPFTASGTKSILLGYSLPSGSLYLSKYSYNYIAKAGDVVNTPARQVTTQASASDNFALIGLTNPGSIKLTIFVNIATGQVTSSGKAPEGFQ